MPERPFQLYGDSVARMIGRRHVMDQLRRGLVKPAPDHIKIVGPRSVGKTVVVEALLAELRATDKPFDGVVRWDLAHPRPHDDDDFLRHLRDQVAVALEARQHYWHKTLAEDYRDDPHDGLKEVLSELADQGIRVLVVLDGLEKTLASGRFTRNLWDNLLDLGRKKSLRYLTVSQGKPHELIRDPESAASDFWGLFNQGVIPIECFNDDDISTALNELAVLELEPGAKTELTNWTLGFPPLVIAVLNELVVSGVSGDVDAPSVVAAAHRASGHVEETLARLWKELPETAKELQRALIKDQEVPTTGRSKRDIEALAERGFAITRGDRIQKPNRLLSQYLATIDDGDGSLQRLFSSESNFIANSRAVLELRLAQIGNLDESLKRSIEKGLMDLPEHPQNCLTNIRNIVDSALELVWNAEIPDRHIPSEWFDTWRYNGEKGPDKWKGQFPRRGGHKIALLHLITGTEESNSVTKHVSRSTYTLIAAAHGFGDFGQHIDGNTVHAATGLAAMAVCVELAATLARELPHKSET
jgi:hypothetical protein